jgi:putative GTP pyrophosphokinase
MTTSSIDRLGQRLQASPRQDADLIQLEDYRMSFLGAYVSVIETITARTNLAATGRPAKSTRAIIEKLRRQSVRLSQVQDIAGCRIIVADVVQQDSTVLELTHILPGTTVVDRRERPSYGYRAVHLIQRVHGKAVEIQVRTALQHLWAEFSEKCSDVVDPEIKYGGGPENLRQSLGEMSAKVSQLEAAQKSLGDIEIKMHSQEVALSRLDTLRSQVAEMKAHPMLDRVDSGRANVTRIEAKICDAEARARFVVDQRPQVEALKRQVEDSATELASLMREAVPALEQYQK